MRIRSIKPEWWADLEVAPEVARDWDNQCPSDWRTAYLYRVYDESEVLLYVGLTRIMYSRLIAHRRKAPWWRDARRIEVWRVRGDDFANTQMLVKHWESACIALQNPLWNKQRRPDWRAHAYQEH